MQDALKSELNDLLECEGHKLENIRFLVNKESNASADDVAAAAIEVVKNIHATGRLHQPPVAAGYIE